MTSSVRLSKVPEVTLTFWCIKILATTLGETAGDTVTMTLGWGYLLGSCVFLAAFAVLVMVQIRARRFHPFLYWGTIIASTTVGTTLADFVDRSLGVGYLGGTLILLCCVLFTLGIWYRSRGSVAMTTVNAPAVEAYYWMTIMFSQTLGTALGDWAADSGLGFSGGAVAFSVLLALVALLYYFTQVSRVALFWGAFILTRPLGATVGDFFDKPHNQGGLDVSRPLASAVLLVLIIALVWWTWVRDRTGQSARRRS